MRISLSPQRRDDKLVLSKSGDTLTINGDLVDLSALPDGATIPADAIESDWIVGDIHRIDGQIRITLILPHGPDPSEQVAFPTAIIVEEDGPIEVPQDPEPEEPSDPVDKEETHDED